MEHMEILFCSSAVVGLQGMRGVWYEELSALKTLCWIAKFRAGGKPQGSLVLDKADGDGV